MPRRRTESWAEVGRRVQQAREAAGLTQAELAEQIGLERTAVTRIEGGDRGINSFELARLSRALDRPLAWFLSIPPPSVVSRRSELVDAEPDEQPDVLIERLATDVELLVDLEVLVMPETPRFEGTITDFAAAEQAAMWLRSKLSIPPGPLPEIAQVAERAGLFAFSFKFGRKAVDGIYVALERGGVTLVNGDADSGRRRFTLAHELGHHVLGHSASTDWINHDAQGHEHLINAFAANLLMPRADVLARLKEVRGHAGLRAALIIVATEYRVSWTAAVTHLAFLGGFPREERERLKGQHPKQAELLEHGAFFVSELEPPTLPRKYVAAVVKAYRKNVVTAPRAVELLHGSITEEDLPAVSPTPLEALRGELRDLG